MNEINVFTATAEELDRAMDAVRVEMGEENPYRYLPTEDELEMMADYFCRR